MILEDDTYPLKHLNSEFPEEGSLKKYLTPDIEKTILKHIQYERNRVIALEKHDLFKQLYGNP